MNNPLNTGRGVFEAKAVTRAIRHGTGAGSAQHAGNSSL